MSLTAFYNLLLRNYLSLKSSPILKDSQTWCLFRHCPNGIVHFLRKTFATKCPKKQLMFGQCQNKHVFFDGAPHSAFVIQPFPHGLITQHGQCIQPVVVCQPLDGAFVCVFSVTESGRRKRVFLELGNYNNGYTPLPTTRHQHRCQSPTFHPAQSHPSLPGRQSSWNERKNL